MEVTQLLVNWRNGNKQALDDLVPLVYAELRKLAVRFLRNERKDHTLQPTGLIHEAYLRLAHQEVPDWKNRIHFYGVAAHLMREILVDHARKTRAAKRGGSAAKINLDETIVCSPKRPADLIAVDDALSALSGIDPRKCRVIELRYFAGLSMQETAEVLNISVATVTRDLRLAEAWLRREIAG